MHSGISASRAHTDRHSELFMMHSRIQSWRYLITVGAIAIVYAAGARLAFLLLNLDIEASPVWPPAGIALAALLLFGRHTWTGIALGAFFFNQALGVSFSAAVGSALGSTLQAVVGASILQQFGFRISLNRLRDAFGLIAVGGIVAPLINAAISTLSGITSGYVESEQMWRNASIIGLGDGMGILVFTPLLLTGWQWTRCGWYPRRAVEAGIWLALLCSGSWLIFCSSTNTAIAEYPLEYLPFPLVVWGALRFGQPGAASASSVISVVAIWGAVHGYGPFIKSTSGGQTILLLQAFMSVVTVSALVLAAAVTERQQTEDLLRRSEASLANAQRIARLGHWDFDCAQQQWHWSDELYRLLGFPPQTIQPSQAAFLSAVHPEDQTRVQRAIETVLLDRTPCQLDYRIILPDGTERIVEEQIAVWETGISGTVQDITERKQAEAALNDSQEKFAKAFRSSPDSITISTLADGRYLDVNETFLKTTGYEREQVIGSTAKSLNVWFNYIDRDRLTQLLLQGEVVRNQEFEFCRKSGEIGVALVSAEIIQLGGESCLLCVTRDITERKRVDAQMRLTAERDRVLAEIALRIRRSLNLDDILNTTVDEVRQFLRADRVFISQYDEDLTGRVIAESVAPGWNSALGWMTDAQVYQEIAASFQRDRLRIVNDTECVERTPFLAEYYSQFQVRAGIGVPIMLNNRLFGVIVANQCSHPRNWQSLEVDLLDQLSTQVAIAIQQAQLYQQVQKLNTSLEKQVAERTEQLQQKMQELQDLNQLKEVFLHAVSHDLRTTVMGMLLVLRNLQSQPGEMVALCRPMLERMIHCGEIQLSKLNSLLEAYISKTQGIDLDLEQIPLPVLIQDVITSLEPLLTENRTTITNLISSQLPLVKADIAHLRRVFHHLLSNAVKHNPPGVSVRLTATVERKMLRCTVEDNGIGMSSEQCDRLFDLCLGSSPDRQLTGISLGLYLCQQIMAAHGGKIGVESAPGKGSTFWLTVPLA